MSLVACLEAVIRRIGGLSPSASREGGRLDCSMSRKVSCAFGAVRLGGMDASAAKRHGMTCAFGLVCSTDIGEEVLWASDQMVLTVDGGRVYYTKA